MVEEIWSLPSMNHVSLSHSISICLRIANTSVYSLPFRGILRPSSDSFHLHQVHSTVGSHKSWIFSPPMCASSHQVTGLNRLAFSGYMEDLNDAFFLSLLLRVPASAADSKLQDVRWQLSSEQLCSCVFRVLRGFSSHGSVKPLASQPGGCWCADWTGLSLGSLLYLVLG